jgi:hypothetical protein
MTEPSDQGNRVTLVVDLASGSARESAAMTLTAAGLRERSDLQRSRVEHPRVVGSNSP